MMGLINTVLEIEEITLTLTTLSHRCILGEYALSLEICREDQS